MLTQRRWRIAGALLLAVSGGLAYAGVRLPLIRESLVAFIAYWAVFLVAFIGAICCAFLDFRYIRMQMAMEERELFRQTLGDESFRRSLREAQEKRAMKGSGKREL